MNELKEKEAQELSKEEINVYAAGCGEKLRRKAVLRIAFISITAVDDNTVLICIKYRL